ncbi:MAG: DUF4143 domain-containing protein [Deltaproteobacteria bacterium]|nr:DUF4143 domain-containing protein [Candidatus Anaeroferrophillacea bacterium]
MRILLSWNRSATASPGASASCTWKPWRPPNCEPPASPEPIWNGSSVSAATPNSGAIPGWGNFVLTEIIKIRNLRPGKVIFFYRDQNGVEVDFVIEQARNLTLIEAKDGERLDSRKRNFNKVAPLLADKHEVACLAAHLLPQARPAVYRDFQAWNPLLGDFQMAIDEP